MSAIFFFDRFSRDTAATDESMAAVMFSNLLTQLDRVRLDEQNFLQRHNMKIIQQQLQVGQLHLTPPQVKVTTNSPKPKRSLHPVTNNKEKQQQHRIDLFHSLMW